MFHKVLTSGAVLAIACLHLTFSAAHAAETPSTMPVTPDFTQHDISWNGGMGKGYVFRTRIFDINGVLALCGAGAYVNSTNRLETKKVLKQTTLKMNGKVILKDFTFFTVVDAVPSLAAAKANCRSTGVATPKAEVKFDIDYGFAHARF